MLCAVMPLSERFAHPTTNFYKEQKMLKNLTDMALSPTIKDIKTVEIPGEVIANLIENADENNALVRGFIHLNSLHPMETPPVRAGRKWGGLHSARV